MIEGSESIWLMNPNPDPEGPKTCGSCGSRSGFGSATLLSIFRLQTHSLTGFLDHFSPSINSFRVFLFLTLSCFILSLSLRLFLSLLSHSSSFSPLPPPLSSSSPGSDDSICELCCLDRIYLLFYCVETDTRPDSRTINSRGGRSTDPLLYLLQRKRWNMMVFWLRHRACCTVHKRLPGPSSALFASHQAESVIYLPVCPFCHVFLKIVANAGQIHQNICTPALDFATKKLKTRAGLEYNLYTVQYSMLYHRAQPISPQFWALSWWILYST